jgi:uncharacterized protein YqeY
MTLKETLYAKMKAAMKDGDKNGLQFVRNIINAVRKKEIDDRVDLDDAAIQKVIQSLLKQRKESLDQFKQGGRADLVAQEELEIAYLEQFLPKQMSDAELKAIVDGVVAEVKPQSPKDMGKVMQGVLARVAGQADGKRVSEFVKARLSGSSG